MEHWKDISGYEGLYQVSDLGRVRSLDRYDAYGRFISGKLRNVCVNKKTGYCYVNLCKNGRSRNILLHRIVASAFIPNPLNLKTVNHKNENKQDNRVENLEWMSLQDNLMYGTHTERATKNKPDISGKRHHNYGLRGSSAHTHKGKVIGTSKFDPSVTVEFDTAATASRVLGISSGQLCDAINGKAKSCGGYYWRRCNA